MSAEHCHYNLDCRIKSDLQPVLLCVLTVWSLLLCQVALMKKHLKGVPGGAVAPEVEHPLQAEDAPDSASAPQSPFKDAGTIQYRHYADSHP